MTIYHAMKTYRGNDRIKYQCIAYNLLGTWCAFTNKIDSVKFIFSCYLSEKRCRNKCKELNKNR